MELSHWRVMLRTDEKLDFKSLPEGGRFSFDDYNTVAELRFTRELINKFNNDAERILSACFQYTNSFDEPWYDYTGDEYVKINSFMKPCRSSSVGDIFQNINENKYWMIAPLGFVRVYPPVDVYLEMARRRRKEKKDAESFEAPKTPKWKKIYYEDEEDGRYKPSVPAPTEDGLDELLRSYEEGMEPYDVEFSQYIVLEDKVVCFVGSYRESFYNHGTGEYTYKRKKHWFGLAYQTLIPYSKLTVEYLEARKNHEHWWEQMLKTEKLQKARFKQSGGDTILPHHGKERNRIYRKEPLQPWTLFEENMWGIDSKNWQRSYRKYDWYIDGFNKKDAKERILEQAQEFVSTEPDWLKNVYADMAKKRVGMKAEEYTPSIEDILDFVHQQFSQGVLQLRYEEIAQYFGIERDEVNLILNQDNKLRKKYSVDGEPYFGDYFLRYKEMPIQSAFSKGSVFYSIKNPFVQARAKGRSYDNKKMRKDRLRKIMFGAEDLTFCPDCYTDSREKKTYYLPYSDDVREWAYYVCKNNWCRGKPTEPQPIEDERLEGAECYMCGEKANYIFEDLPTGAKPFCTEKCLCDYAGYPYMGEGYYGLRPIGGESFNVRRVLQNTGRLDWRM